MATAAVATPVPCIVDNRALAVQTTFDVVSPADRTTVLHQVAAFQATGLNDLLASSSRGLESWRNTSITERREVFVKAAVLLRERLPQLIEVEANETTASAGFAAFELGVLATSSLDETSAAMSAALRGEMAPIDPSGKRMSVIREPLGVVLSIGACVAMAPKSP